MRNRIAACAFLGCLSWLSAVVYAHQTPGTPAKTPIASLPTAAAVTAAVSVAVPTAAALDPATPGWSAGRWYAYRVHMTSAVTMGGTANAFDFDVDGTLEITPTDRTTDAVTLYVALANPKIVSRVPGSKATFDKIEAQIQSTGCFVVLSGGRVAEMRTPRGLSASVANIYREIASGLQFVRTLQAADEYSAEEYDTTGRYVAEYRLDRDQTSWHKRKQRYLAILAARTAPAGTPAHIVPRIDGSEWDVRLAPDGRPQTVSLRDVITVSGAQQPIHSTTALSLAALRDDAARRPGPDWGALLGAMERTGADEPYGATASVDALDQARIKGMTFEKAVAELEQIEKEKGRTPTYSSVNGAAVDADEQARREQKTADESRAFIALAAIFREKPLTIPAALRKIRAKSPAAGTLISALSSASSPAAQSALVDLANAKTTAPEMRTQVLFALSRTPRPDKKSVQALEDLLKSDRYSEDGLLGLGTFSRRLRDSGDADQAAEIGAILVDRLRTAPTQPDQLTALRAVGNSGYAPALPAVLPFLSDSRELIRATATRALQSMRDASVDAILADRMQTDAASDVRIAALGAAKVREPNDVLARAVETAAVSGPDPRIRFRAVELLALWMPSRPDVRSTLEQVAENDGETRVRDRARGAL